MGVFPVTQEVGAGLYQDGSYRDIETTNQCVWSMFDIGQHIAAASSPDGVKHIDTCYLMRSVWDAWSPERKATGQTDANGVGFFFF